MDFHEAVKKLPHKLAGVFVRKEGYILGVDRNVMARRNGEQQGHGVAPKHGRRGEEKARGARVVRRRHQQPQRSPLRERGFGVWKLRRASASQLQQLRQNVSLHQRAVARRERLVVAALGSNTA